MPCEPEGRRKARSLFFIRIKASSFRFGIVSFPVLFYDALVSANLLTRSAASQPSIADWLWRLIVRTTVTFQTLSALHVQVGCKSLTCIMSGKDLLSTEILCVAINLFKSYLPNSLPTCICTYLPTYTSISVDLCLWQFQNLTPWVILYNVQCTFVHASISAGEAVERATVYKRMKYSTSTNTHTFGWRGKDYQMQLYMDMYM